MDGLPPAGWYDDPETSGQQRWWNGAAWGTERRPLPSSETAQGHMGVRFPEFDQASSSKAVRTGFQPHVPLIAVGLATLLYNLLRLFMIDPDHTSSLESAGLFAALGGVIALIGLGFRQAGVTWDSALNEPKSGSTNAPDGTSRPSSSMDTQEAGPLNASSEQAGSSTSEGRLDEIERLHQLGKLNDEERAEARRRIIEDL